MDSSPIIVADDFERKNLNKLFNTKFNTCQQEISKYNKAENNIQNSIKALSEIISNAENMQTYPILLSKLNKTLEELSDLVKPLPDEVTKISADSRFQHYLIDKPPGNVYQYADEELKELIGKASVYSTVLRCQMELTEENKQKAMESLLNNLENVDSELFKLYSGLLNSS